MFSYLTRSPNNTQDNMYINTSRGPQTERIKCVDKTRSTSTSSGVHLPTDVHIVVHKSVQSSVKVEENLYFIAKSC